MHIAFHYIVVIQAIAMLLYAFYLIVHIIYWLFSYTPTCISEYRTKVSLIVPVRNEGSNIAACLQSILAQDYPHHLMEVIVCDDGSEDNTEAEVLRTLNNFPALVKYVRISGALCGKKQAIETAIKQSSGELIVTTDADCVAEKVWVSALVSVYQQHDGATMLCGPVSIIGKNTLFEKIQELEMCGLSLLSGGGIRAGTPLLCSAANMAYTRKAFDAVEGFKNAEHTPSGDDTLLMFKLHKRFPGSVHYVKNRNAMVYTPAQTTVKDFFNQRIRWASKGFRSDYWLNSMVSLLAFFANFLPIVSILLWFEYPVFTASIAASIALKLVVDFLLLSFATKFFRKSGLLLYYPIASVWVIFYINLTAIMASFCKYTWKGRVY